MKLIIRMRGGLGNQMFQYSYAYLISKYVDNVQICFDVREYNDYYWPFNIIDFKIGDYEIFSSGKLKYDFAIKKYHIFQKVYRVIHNEAPNFYRKKDLRKGYLFSGTWSPFFKIEETKDYYLYGYFQNSLLLNQINEDLLNIFTLKNVRKDVLKYLTAIKNNSIAVSVRTLTLAEKKALKKTNNIENISFYYKGIRKLIDKYKSDRLFVFSNDIEFYKNKNIFKDIVDNVIYVDSCSATEQMEIMKRFNLFVISNSTFSWWGAFLGHCRNKNVEVICPKTWYIDVNLQNTKLFFDGMIPI